MRLRSLSRTATTNEEFAGAYDLARTLLTDRGTDDRDIASEATERMLRRRQARGDTHHWRSLADEAEHHGVAPLLEPLIVGLARKTPELVPDETRLAFIALASRHRRAAQAREQCVDRLLAAFAAAGIPLVLLKGAALAHRIYPSPELRAMVDIDVLIDPADADTAVCVTRDLGYGFASAHGSRFAARMHHLPVASTVESGFRISLEIHTDAMSPNQRGSLTLASLTGKLQSFRRGSGPDGLALGHTDMLRHLARHAFEPAHRIRLIHLYDLWRYQARFRDEIDWREVGARFPDVIVILQLVSQVFVTPPAAGHAPDAASVSAPAGVGLGMVPLAEIASADMAFTGKLAAIFNPPAWWLHGFYGIAPERSLFACRTVRHPLRVMRWMTTRLAAGSGLSAADPAIRADVQNDRPTQVNR